MSKSVYSEAVRMGYIYRYGKGKIAADGETWLTRFQKEADPERRPVLYLGYNPDRSQWVKEELQ